MNKYTNLRKKPSKKILLAAIAGIIVLGGIVLFSSRSNSSSRALGASDITVAPAEDTIDVSREFQFPIVDETGEEVSKIKYFIESVDLRNELVVQGQKVTAIQGRMFLVVTLKLSNELEKDIEINTRDYVRLQVNGSSEHLAADIHNDPVQVAAIATKSTRLAFPIDDDPNQELVLRVGEIKGYKEELPINFN